MPTRYVEPMPVLSVGDESNREVLLDSATAADTVTPSIRIIEGDELLEHCPVINPDTITVGMLEPTAGSIDVMGVHQHYLRNARRDGAQVMRSARVTKGRRDGQGWILTTEAREVRADVVVNASGAWGDVVAAACGVAPVGLQPKRRTAFTARAPVDPTGWPFIYSSIPGLECYFKAEAGAQLLCSLSDEQDSEPCDARPEEVDIALAIERINTISTLDVRSVTTTWAGLRTFAPDRNPAGVLLQSGGRCATLVFTERRTRLRAVRRSTRGSRYRIGDRADQHHLHLGRAFGDHHLGRTPHLRSRPQPGVRLGRCR